MPRTQTKYDYFSANVQVVEVEQQLADAQARIAELEQLNQKLQSVAHTQAQSSSGVAELLPITAIVRDEGQVRRYFDPDRQASLLASIQEVGIRESLWVRPLGGQQYLLIAGERRYRAAVEAGLTHVPVLILDVDDETALKLSLVENLQREDLNALEETEGILRLLALQLACTPKDVIALLNRKAHLDKRLEVIDEVTENVFRKQWESLEAVFAVVGKFSPESFRVSRLPLLNLPEDVQTALRQGQIEYTKARAIARVKEEADRQELLADAIADNLSLSEIRHRIRALKPVQAPSLRTRFKDIASQMLKLPKDDWDDPKKAKKITKLLEQLEGLVSPSEE